MKFNYIIIVKIMLLSFFAVGNAKNFKEIKFTHNGVKQKLRVLEFKGKKRIKCNLSDETVHSRIKEINEVLKIIKDYLCEVEKINNGQSQIDGLLLLYSSESREEIKYILENKDIKNKWLAQVKKLESLVVNLILTKGDEFMLIASHSNPKNINRLSNKMPIEFLLKKEKSKFYLVAGIPKYKAFDNYIEYYLKNKK